MRVPDWLASVSTADLRFHLSQDRTHLKAHRLAASAPDLDPPERAVYAKAVLIDLEDLRLIVAELRRRGERVDWEE